MHWGEKGSDNLSKKDKEMSETFKEHFDNTRKLYQLFESVEQKPWGIEGSMMELSKQVGDLAKRVMVAEKYYIKVREKDPEYLASKDKIADELFDIWFCLVRIADYYKIDLEEAINKIVRYELDNFENNEH